MVKIILCKCKFRIELGVHSGLKTFEKARLGLRKLKVSVFAIKKEKKKEWKKEKVSLLQTQ